MTGPLGVTVHSHNIENIEEFLHRQYNGGGLVAEVELKKTIFIEHTVYIFFMSDTFIHTNQKHSKRGLILKPKEFVDK